MGDQPPRCNAVSEVTAISPAQRLPLLPGTNGRWCILGPAGDDGNLRPYHSGGALREGLAVALSKLVNHQPVVGLPLPLERRLRCIVLERDLLA